MLAFLLYAFAQTAVTAPVAATAATVPVLKTLGAVDYDDVEDIAAAFAQDATAQSEVGPSPRPIAPIGVSPSFNPAISVVLDVALAGFSTEEPLQTGAHDPSENGFNLQQLEMSISSIVDPYFRFDSNLVFGLAGVEIEEAYGTTLALPFSLQARAGQFLTQFGRLNETHPHAWAFADQPIILGKYFGGEGNRGLGVELSYLTPLPWYVEVIASSTSAHGAGTARSFYGGDDLAVESPLDLQTTLALKQFFPVSDDWSLNWGLSAALGPNATGRDNSTDIFGTDVYLKWRPISGGDDLRWIGLQAEYLARRRQVPQDRLTDHGGYAYLLWRMNRHWETGVRGEYATGVENDPLDPEWNGVRERFSGQLTHYPSEFSRIRAQVNRDIPTWRDPYWGAFVALELIIGAHGAHAF